MCCVPAVVHTSVHVTAWPWPQARARETVGASAPNSITQSISQLSLRIGAIVQDMVVFT
jgi:hypothetical protein